MITVEEFNELEKGQYPRALDEIIITNTLGIIKAHDGALSFDEIVRMGPKDWGDSKSSKTKEEYFTSVIEALSCRGLIEIRVDGFDFYIMAK